MRQGFIALQLVLTAIASFVVNAEQQLTVVRILLPIKKEAVSEIRLGDRRCRILSISSSANIPSILVHTSNYHPTHFAQEDDGYGEVLAFMEAMGGGARVPLEVWSSLSIGRYEISASFGAGRVSILRTKAGRPNYESRGLTSDHSEVIRLVSRRFAGRGPVRLFLVDAFFSVDAREPGSFSSGAFNTTAIEPFWDHVGDSGITVYPVIIPLRKNRPSRPMLRRTFSSKLFGTSEIIAGGEYGAALMEAHQNAQQEIVVEIEIPRQYYTGFRRAPKLQVFSEDGVKRFERPFIAGGEPIAEVAAREEMEHSLSRVVKSLVVRSAALKHNCPGISSDDRSGFFLHLRDAEFAASQPARSVVWVTSQAPGVFVERDAKATLIRDESNGCLGPLSSPFGRTLFVYDPNRMWLATFEIQGAK